MVGTLVSSLVYESEKGCVPISLFPYWGGTVVGSSMSALGYKSEKGCVPISLSPYWGATGGRLLNVVPGIQK